MEEVDEMRFHLRLSVGDFMSFRHEKDNVIIGAEVWNSESKCQQKLYTLLSEEEFVANFDDHWSAIGQKIKALMLEIEGLSS
jgi:hypothetical protein